NGAQKLHVESGVSAVAVDGGQEDLAGSELFGAAAPLHGVELGQLLSAAHRGAPAVAYPFGVTREDDGLDAEFARAVGDELRIADGGRVDGHPVGPGAEERAEIFDRPHAAADGEGDEERIR